MGTPDFAVPSLQALLDAGHEIAAVYTQPDKPVGRRQLLTPPPVKELALRCGLPVYQPTKLRDGTEAARLRELAPDLIAVVAYGRILPKEILEIPRLGCVNVHGSLLPKYRGAAPIQWAVINGETETGITTMVMGEGLEGSWTNWTATDSVRSRNSSFRVSPESARWMNRRQGNRLVSSSEGSMGCSTRGTGL